MRGSRTPAVRQLPTEAQTKFHGLTRHRKVKVATMAKTTLIKAEQWARGDGAEEAVSSALESAVVHALERHAKAKK